MATENCPLGYSCENPAQCFQVGLGLDTAGETAAREANLVVRSASETSSGIPQLLICDAPIDENYLTPQAEAAQRIHPRLAAGFDSVIKAALKAVEAVDEVDGGTVQFDLTNHG